MIVFAGPSVPAHTRHHHCDIDWRPPAVAGDLLALVEQQPHKVLLIDGLFDERASVKHKEAIALMAAGTRLYGASSMGALRASELQQQGMIPLGRIARAYCKEWLTGDDEVALVHGDERIGWKAVSVAMVDVRATLVRAVRDKLIGTATARALRQRWHDIHFVDRDWPAMIEAGRDLVETGTAEAIASRHVPLKMMDAEGAIASARADRAPAPSRARLHETWFYDRLVAELKVRDSA